ncbi:MAG: PP0621 family protein [Casimicrobium sp.]
MGKVIFWIVVFFLVLLALRMISVHKSRREAREEREENAEREARRHGGAPRDTTPANDAMVRCAKCNVYIPKANAVMSKSGMTCGNANCEQLTKK